MRSEFIFCRAGQHLEAPTDLQVTAAYRFAVSCAEASTKYSSVSYRLWAGAFCISVVTASVVICSNGSTRLGPDGMFSHVGIIYGNMLISVAKPCLHWRRYKFCHQLRGAEVYPMVIAFPRGCDSCLTALCYRKQSFKK